MRLRNGAFLTLLLFCLCAFFSLSWYAALSGQKGEPLPAGAAPLPARPGRRPGPRGSGARRGRRPEAGARAPSPPGRRGRTPLPARPRLFAAGVTTLPPGRGRASSRGPGGRPGLASASCARAGAGRPLWRAGELGVPGEGREAQGQRRLRRLRARGCPVPESRVKWQAVVQAALSRPTTAPPRPAPRAAPEGLSSPPAEPLAPGLLHGEAFLGLPACGVPWGPQEQPTWRPLHLRYVASREVCCSWPVHRRGPPSLLAHFGLRGQTPALAPCWLGWMGLSGAFAEGTRLRRPSQASVDPACSTRGSRKSCFLPASSFPCRRPRQDRAEAADLSLTPTSCFSVPSRGCRRGLSDPRSPRVPTWLLSAQLSPALFGWRLGLSLGHQEAWTENPRTWSVEATAGAEFSVGLCTWSVRPREGHGWGRVLCR